MTSRWNMQLTDPNAIAVARVAAASVGRVGNGAPYVTEDGRLAIPYDPTDGMRAFLFEVRGMMPISTGAVACVNEVFPRLGLRVGGLIALRGDTAKERLGHVDWQCVNRQFWKLDAWRNAPGLCKHVPQLVVRWGAVPKSGFVSGHAWCEMHRMVITIPPDATIADVYETILHEQAHLRGYQGHNSTFRTALNAAAIEALRVPGVDPLGEWQTQPQFDQTLADQIRANQNIDDDAPTLVKANELRVRPSRAERLAAIVLQRYERARATLAVHEAKLRREQLLVRKWKAKVNGYERRAAAKRAPRNGEGP